MYQCKRRFIGIGVLLGIVCMNGCSIEDPAVERKTGKQDVIIDAGVNKRVERARSESLDRGGTRAFSSEEAIVYAEYLENLKNKGMNRHDSVLRLVDGVCRIEKGERYWFVEYIMKENAINGMQELNLEVLDALIERGELDLVRGIGMSAPRAFITRKSFAYVLRRNAKKQGVEEMLRKFSKYEGYFLDLLEYNEDAVQMLDKHIGETMTMNVMGRPFDELARIGSKEAIVVLKKYADPESKYRACRIRSCVGDHCTIGAYINKLLEKIENTDREKRKSKKD